MTDNIDITAETVPPQETLPQKSGKKQKRRVSLSSVIVFGTVGLLMLIVAVSYVYVLFWAVMSSFKDMVNYALDPLGLPDMFFLENYANAWNDLTLQVWLTRQTKYVYFSYGKMFLYSVMMTIIDSFTAVFMPMLAAYVVARYRFWGRNTIYRVAIFTMIIPVYGALASSISVRRVLGIYDNFLPFMLTKNGAFGFNFVLLYGAFKGLPSAFAEAAQIDGAGHQRIMWRIYVPMMMPTLIALFILGFITGWNDYMTVLTYLPSTPNLAYGVYMFNQHATVYQIPPSEVLAGYILVAVPTTIVWLISQKLIVGKIVVGGLKG